MRSSGVQCRLSGKAFWISPGSSRDRDRLDQIVSTIRRFINFEEIAGLADQIRAMVRSGNRLGAIKLLRVEQGRNLADAKYRVEEIATAEEVV